MPGPMHSQDGEHLTLEKGDILFYNTERRWEGQARKFPQRTFDNALIRFLQKSPMTHTAIVVDVNDEGIPMIIDIVADKAVNIHSVREGDSKLEGTVFRPKGRYANQLCDKLAGLAQAHVGDDNIGFEFSRPKTWSTIEWMLCCFPFYPKVWVKRGKSYADFVLTDMADKAGEQRFGLEKDEFHTYCSEFSGLMLTLALKEVLEQEEVMEAHSAWLKAFATDLERTTTAQLYERMVHMPKTAPVQFDTFLWQNGECVRPHRAPATELTALVAET